MHSKPHSAVLWAFMFFFLFLGFQVSTVSTSANTVIIGDDIEYPPFSFVDDNGEPTGFNIELVKSLGQVMGWDIEVRLMPWSEVMESLDRGELDAISGMFYSDERARDYLFTTRHSVASGDVFTRIDHRVNSIQDLQGTIVAAQEGDIVYEYLKHQNLGVEFILVQTSADALRMLARGDVDFAAVLRVPGHYAIQDYQLTNVRGNGLQIAPYDYGMAVLKGNDTLAVALDEGLQILRATGRYQELYDVWLGVYDRQGIFQDLRKYLWVIGSLILLGLLVFAWAVSLKRMVARRTGELASSNASLLDSQQELQYANEELEATIQQLSAATEELITQNEQLAEGEQKLRVSENSIKAIINAIPDLLFTIGESGTFLHCYSGAQVWENMALKPSAIAGLSIEDVVSHKDALQAYACIKRVLSGGQVESFEFCSNTDSGLRYYEWRMAPFSDKEVISMFRDVTSRSIAEQELADERDLLHTTLLSVGDGVVVTDKLGIVTMLNPRASLLLGGGAQGFVGKNIQQLFPGVFNEQILNQVLYEESIVQLARAFLTTQSGVTLGIASTLAPIKDSKGLVRGCVVVFRDITESLRNQEQIEYLSYRDHLTALFNRRFFEKELAKAEEQGCLPLTIVLADVNGLKLTNDAFGHDVGDQLLIEVAHALERGVDKRGTVARLGGDEFAILLPNTDGEKAKEIIKQIRSLADQTKIQSIKLSISFGWDTKVDENSTAHEIMNKAENNMYKNKLFERPSHRARTINVIINALYEKNRREEEHSHRVAELCMAMGKALNMSAEEVQELRTIGLLHDIGKIAIDEGILNETGRLTDAQWVEIKRHPEAGYRILSAVSDMSDVAEYVLAHHERYDGMGYPQGLNGDEIPLMSRIVSVADAYDAMTSERSYRAPLQPELVQRELVNNAGTQFDPILVDVFLEKVLPNLAISRQH